MPMDNEAIKTPEEKEGVNLNIFKRGFEALQNLSSSLDGSEVEIEKKYARNVIGVFGIGGGCGASSFIIELAEKFTQKNHTVCILDGHLLNPFMRLYHEGGDSVPSITDKLLSDKNYKEAIVKSNFNSKVYFYNQQAVSIISVSKIDGDITNFKIMTDWINEIRQEFDIILIDLSIELLNINIVQAMLKSCTQLIEIHSDSIKSSLLKPGVEDNIAITSSTPILEIVNKCRDNLAMSLPYEKEFKETYNNARPFISQGIGNSGYNKRFTLIFEALEKNIGGGNN